MADDITPDPTPDPVDLGPIYDQVGQKYGLDPGLLRAIGDQESSQNTMAIGPEVEGGKRALGVMQILSSNLKPYGVTDWRDPAQNIDAGARILKEKLQGSKGDIASALQDYSGGASGYADQVLGRLNIQPDDGSVPDIQPDEPTGGQGALALGLQGLERGVGQSATGVAQTVTGPFQNRPQQQQVNDELQQELNKPFSISNLLDPKWLTANIGYSLGSASPAVGGAILGGIGASAVGAPEAAPVAAIGGAMAGSALSDLARSYQNAINDGLSHDDAVTRAIEETGINSAVTGVMSALPGGKFLGNWAEGTLKRSVSEAMINIFGTAPAAGATGQVATAVLENKPLSLDDLLKGYLQNAVTGAAFEGVGRVASKILPERTAPEATTEAQAATPGRGEGPSSVPPEVAPIEPNGGPGVPGEPGANVRPAEEAPVLGEFTTAKGSVYQIHDDGTTTRNKSFHPEHGEADQGLQPRSENTWYVTPGQADVLGEFQARNQSGKVAIQPLSDGRIGMRYLDGPDAGRFERRTVLTPDTKPDRGLIPVETWNGGQRVHFGNEITDVRIGAPQPPIEPASAPAEPLVATPRGPAGAVGMPKPIQGTGEAKTRGLAQSVEASAIQHELTESFGDLPGYNVLKDEGQGAAALALLQTDPARADAIAMGRKAAPPGVLPSAVFVAVKRAAEEAGDVDKLRDLATRSKFLASVTTLGQNISYLRNVGGNTDSVRAMVSLQKSLDQNAVNRNLQPKIDRTVADNNAYIQKMTPKPSRAEWDNWAQSIMCK